VGIGLLWGRDPSSLTFVVAELFDVDGYVDSQPFAARPTVVRPPGDVRVGIPTMGT